MPNTKETRCRNARMKARQGIERTTQVRPASLHLRLQELHLHFLRDIYVRVGMPMTKYPYIFLFDILLQANSSMRLLGIELSSENEMILYALSC